MTVVHGVAGACREWVAGVVIRSVDATGRKQEAMTESNLVKHARRELTLVGEDQDTIEGLVRVVQAFADMGHSGGSASIAIPMLNHLLRFKNLTPLTDDPNEWFHHTAEMSGEPGGIWQNIRDGEAFSTDGGKTYTLLSERPKHGPYWLRRRMHRVHRSLPFVEAKEQGDE